MTVKVKYENGVLKPLKKVNLENDKVYEMEIKKKKRIEIKTISPKALEKLCGIISIGGDAVKDSEDIYE